MLTALARSTRSTTGRLALGRLLNTTGIQRSDPYPLPHTPQHVNAGGRRIPSGADAPYSSGSLETDVDLADPELPFPEPLPRPNETTETLRARLVYQTRKRGTLESDLIMSTFAKEHMEHMTEQELKEFDRVRCMFLLHYGIPLFLLSAEHFPVTLLAFLYLVRTTRIRRLYADATYCSYWTRTTGTHTTGRRRRRPPRSAGLTLHCSKSCECIHETRARLCAGCPTSRWPGYRSSKQSLKERAYRPALWQSGWCDCTSYYTYFEVPIVTNITISDH
jgi:hypothetical protein